MLIELFGDSREILRPLFHGYRPLHGAVHAALSGDFGRAWTDSVTAPRVAMLELEFYFVAGDTDAPAAEAMIRAIPRGTTVAPANDAWAALIRRVCSNGLTERTRIGFDAGSWNTARLKQQASALPPGCALKRVTAADVDRYATLEHALISNYRSTRDFIEHGVGFGIEQDGRFVAGCASFCLADGKLEFEIQTHSDYRRRGLATAAAAAMILHCIEHNLDACWDAHNEASALLAEKLGFIHRTPYTVFELTA